MAHTCPVCEAYCTCDCDDIYWQDGEYDGPCHHHETEDCISEFDEDDDLHEGQHEDHITATETT